MKFSEALNTHVTAIRQRDLPAFMATVHDEASVILPNGKMLSGHAEIEAFHRDWFADLDWKMDVDLQKTFESDEACVAVLDVTYDDVDPDGAPYQKRYLLSLVFTRSGDRWLLTHDQNTFR